MENPGQYVFEPFLRFVRAGSGVGEHGQSENALISVENGWEFSHFSGPLHLLSKDSRKNKVRIL